MNLGRLAVAQSRSKREPSKTEVVDGVTATVVHDRVTTADGALVEDTYDWFARDRQGNVWYVGEATKAYEENKVRASGGPCRWRAARRG